MKNRFGKYYSLKVNIFDVLKKIILIKIFVIKDFPSFDFWFDFDTVEGDKGAVMVGNLWQSAMTCNTIDVKTKYQIDQGRCGFGDSSWNIYDLAEAKTLKKLWRTIIKWLRL